MCFALREYLCHTMSEEVNEFMSRVVQYEQKRNWSPTMVTLAAMDGLSSICYIPLANGLKGLLASILRTKCGPQNFFLLSEICSDLATVKETEKCDALSTCQSMLKLSEAPSGDQVLKLLPAMPWIFESHLAIGTTYSNKINGEMKMSPIIYLHRSSHIHHVWVEQLSTQSQPNFSSFSLMCHSLVSRTVRNQLDWHTKAMKCSTFHPPHI